jgi:exo-1,4-beta-D-glucosaminidase
MNLKKLTPISLYVFITVFIIMGFFACQKASKISPSEILLDEGWHIRSSADLSEAGDVLSKAGLDIATWYPTTVPSTVLAVLVKNGVYKDPFFGKNLERIPTDQFQKAWWYRKEFTVDEQMAHTNARLLFEGINYSANVWLNGKKIASADKIHGAFRMFDIDITSTILPGTNTLAVEVLPPVPGNFTIGFVDWNPKPPDDSMGIWRDVRLRLTGPVSIHRPFVQTRLNLNTLDEAKLTISAELTNHTKKKLSGILKGEIEQMEFDRPFALEPHETKEISFHPAEHEALSIDSPRLWWPNHLGEPNLYTLKLTATVDGALSDWTEVRFGIREVSDYLNQEGHRGYTINGKKVLIRGGGWVDDLFLIEDPKKVEAQIKYAKHMNLNALRLEGFWGSSQTLYDLADQHGILLMPGWSCHWEWEGYAGKPVDQFGGIETPAEMDLIARSLRDQVVWLRNHPSILVWVLGSDKLPRPELEKKYKSYLDNIDPTRPILSSCKSLKSAVSGPTAVKMNGPYDYVTPNYWYVDKTRGGAFGFNTETGPGPQPPPLESIKKMIPEEHLWPSDDYWNFHCARNEFNSLDRYMLSLNERYGASESEEEFARLAQVANYEAIRAMFESFGVNKPTATGIIHWMYNSAWPGMFWQLFDYYLMPNGAFYGTKTACEPLNIVYNYGDQDIYIVNDTHRTYSDLTAEIQVFNIGSKRVFKQDFPVSVGAYTSIKILETPKMESLSPVYFMDLELKDASENLLSSNFYWLSTQEDILDEEHSTWFYTPNKAFADFTGLRDLQKVQIVAAHRFEDLGEEMEIRVTLQNPSDRIAFFINMNVYRAESGHSVLPIFWDDNFISLVPGETREIRARFLKEDLKGETPAFRLSGWNVKND